MSHIRPTSDASAASATDPFLASGGHDVAGLHTPDPSGAGVTISDPTGRGSANPLQSRGSGRTKESAASSQHPFFLRTGVILAIVIALLVALALGVGLGVGLSRRDNNSASAQSNGAGSTIVVSETVAGGTVTITPSAPGSGQNSTSVILRTSTLAAVGSTVTAAGEVVTSIATVSTTLPPGTVTSLIRVTSVTGTRVTTVGGVTSTISQFVTRTITSTIVRTATIAAKRQKRTGKWTDGDSNVFMPRAAPLL